MSSSTPTQPTPGAVFLSYAREDTEAARRIADALRAFGVEVWFDQSELRGGDSWDSKIKKQIRECALFLPLVSTHTQERTEGYFRREWLLAVERTRDMAHGIAFIVPVVIDESLVDLESFHLSRKLGYSGVALKVCKGQSHAVLMAAAGQKYKSFLCVQDLSCPGASLIHSASIASHVPGVSGIEANSRQYLPAANDPWRAKFPGIFTIKDGTMKTAALTGLGLGAV